MNQEMYGSLILIDICVSCSFHLSHPSQLGANLTIELMDLRLNIFPDLIIPLTSPFIAKVCYCAVPIYLFFGVSNWITLEPTAVIVFVEYANPAGDKIENIHFLNLIFLLFAF
jgi:hypothetical protein